MNCKLRGRKRGRERWVGEEDRQLSSVKYLLVLSLQVYKNVVSMKKQHPELQVLVRVEGNWTTLIHDAEAIAV